MHFLLRILTAAADVAVGKSTSWRAIKINKLNCRKEESLLGI
jgi:hypothetical protein